MTLDTHTHTPAHTPNHDHLLCKHAHTLTTTLSLEKQINHVYVNHYFNQTVTCSNYRSEKIDISRHELMYHLKSGILNN